MTAIGPTLPSAASAGHGSYQGISCRQRRSYTTVEDDPDRTRPAELISRATICLIRIEQSTRDELVILHERPDRVGLGFQITSPFARSRMQQGRSSIGTLCRRNDRIRRRAATAISRRRSRDWPATGEPSSKARVNAATRAVNTSSSLATVIVSQVAGFSSRIGQEVDVISIDGRVP